MQVLVPMAGLIDKDAELARSTREIARLDGEVKRVGGKLSNAGFVDKAPAEVIDKERAPNWPRPNRPRPSCRNSATASPRSDASPVTERPARKVLAFCLWRSS